jgi:tetratricopeptide (TPR) repeat protein
MCARGAIAFALLLAASALPIPASAQTPQELNWCNGKDGATPDRQIGGCTALIESGKLTGKNLAFAFNNRGNAYLNKKDYDRAIANYSDAIRLDPSYAVAFRNRGLTYRYKKDHDRAIADYSDAVRLDPKYAGAYNDRCFYRAIIGQLQQALADCNESLRIRPNDANTLDSRGFAHLKLGEYDQAIADYNAALKRNPKLAGSLYGRGIAKLKKGDVHGYADITAATAIRADIAEQEEYKGL